MNKLLPMEEYAQEFIRTLAQFRVVIVVGETGCGKTTKIPQILLGAGYAEKGIIACTEPRRIAAIAATRRVSTERNEETGATIGYHVRFEEAQSKETKVLFMTDGMLMQKVRHDPLLRRYSVIIVDEAHERNLYTDFTLAYLKSLVGHRPDLKVVIASATIDPVKFMGYFCTLGLVKVPGRVYPVEIEYRSNRGKMIETAAQAVREIHTKREGGDILVFLPGIGEIRALRSVLLKMKLRGIEMPLLYGGMEPSEQERVFERVPGRKVILATNVAETSITIPGVRYVVDSGYVRFPGYNPDQEVETLYLEQISQASATQRAGRAGRTQNGVCIRLVPQAEYERLPVQTEPEISRSDLTGLVLTARRYGIENVSNLDLLTRPPGKSVERAVAMLTNWGALDSAGRITPYGEQLAKISVEPVLARFMTLAAEEGCLKEAATIAAFLSVRNIFFREGGFGGFGDTVPQVFRDPMGDLFSYLRVWFSYQAPLNHPTTWCQKHSLNPRVILGICRIRSQIIQEAKRAGLPINSSISREAIGRAIVRAFSHNLCLYEGKGQYCSGKRHGIKIAKSSVLSGREPDRFVAVSFLDAGNFWSKNLWAIGNVEVQPEWNDLLPKQKEIETKMVGELPFPIHGTVQITDRGKRRTIQVLLDPTESQTTAIKTVAQGCLALNLSKIPFPEFEKVCAVSHERTRPLTKDKRFAPFPIIFEEDEKLREQITKGAGIEDRLLEHFLDQPFQALELSGGAVMKLLAGGLTNVRDITKCSERQLFGGKGRQGMDSEFHFKDLPKFDDDEVEEIKERLANYGLRLKEEWELRKSAFLPEGEIRVLQNHVDSGQAKETLGEEDFADLLMMRSLPKTEAMKVRNRLCARHYRLPWKIGIAYEWVIPVHKQDPANEGQDYAQEGSIGLLRAIIAFDPLAGYRFSTYATIWIKQAITRYIANGGLIRIPVHRIELEQRVLAKINQFETKYGRSPNEKELADLLGLEPAQVRAVLDEIRVLRRILRLERPLKPRLKEVGDEKQENVFANLIPDQRPLAEEELIAREFSQETNRMLSEAPLIDLDKRIIELYFGLNGENEHTLEEIGDIIGITGERIRQRLSRALDTLRTRGNWERMSAFHQLRPLPEAESQARWDKAINALLNVLKEEEESEESWLLEQYLETLARHLELPLDKLTAETEDLKFRQARMAAAALLWHPGGLKLEEIVQRLKFPNLGAVRNAMYKVSLQLRKRKYDALAQTFELPKPLKSESGDIEIDLEQEMDDGVETSPLPPTTPEEVGQVRTLLDKIELTPRQRLILEERLGFDKPGATLEELGQALGVTRERIRQLQEEAIKKLKTSLVWPELQPFLEPIFKEVVRKYDAKKSELR